MKIQTYMKALITLMMFCFNVNSSIADMSPATTYGSPVDDVGNITLPTDFRDDWTYLSGYPVLAD